MMDSGNLYRKTPALLQAVAADGRLIEVSDRWLQVLGYERDQVIGRAMTDFLTPASKQNDQALYLPALYLPESLTCGQVKEGECEFVKSNGETVAVLASV